MSGENFNFTKIIQNTCTNFWRMENKFPKPENKFFRFFQNLIFDFFPLRFSILNKIKNIWKFWNSFLKQTNDGTTIKTCPTPKTNYKLEFCLLFYGKNNYCTFFSFFLKFWFFKILRFFDKKWRWEMKIICWAKYLW